MAKTSGTGQEGASQDAGAEDRASYNANREDGSAEANASPRCQTVITVLVGIPNLRVNDRFAAFKQKIEAAIRESLIYFPEVKFTFLSTAPTGKLGLLGIVDRQNFLREQALVGKFDYLWLVQADVEVPRHAFGRLFEFDVDVAYGVVKRHDENEFIAGFIDENKKVWYMPRFVLKANLLRGPVFAGCSCILIKRRVLEKVSFRIEAGIGEDVMFAFDVAMSGFTAVVDGQVECGHLPQKPLENNSLNVGCGHFPTGEVNLDLYPEPSPHRSADQNRCDDWPIDMEKTENFVQADGQHLPFADGSFDHVFSDQLIEHVQDPKLLVEEIMRVARFTAEIRCPDPDGPYARSKTMALHRNVLTPAWYHKLLDERFKVSCSVDKNRSHLIANILKPRTAK